MRQFLKRLNEAAKVYRPVSSLPDRICEECGGEGGQHWARCSFWETIVNMDDDLPRDEDEDYED